MVAQAVSTIFTVETILDLPMARLLDLTQDTTLDLFLTQLINLLPFSKDTLQHMEKDIGERTIFNK